MPLRAGLLALIVLVAGVAVASEAAVPQVPEPEALSDWVFVADRATHQVWRYNTNGLQGLAIVDSANDGLNGPWGLGLMRGGWLLVATTDGKVLKTNETGVSTTVFADVSDGLDAPIHPAVSPFGDVFVADRDLRAVVRFDSAGLKLGSTALPSGTPTALAFDSTGAFKVACQSPHMIHSFDALGRYVGVFVSSGLSYPSGLAWNSADGSWIVSGSDNTLRRYSAAGVSLGVFADSSDGLSSPGHLIWRIAGNDLLVVNRGLDQVVRFSSSGTALGAFTTGYYTPDGIVTWRELPPLGSAGGIRFGAATWSCETTATLAVVDKDLNASAAVAETVTVRVWSQTESAPETVVLTEDGPDTSVFRGSIRLSATNSSGVVQVTSNDLVSAAYDDAVHGASGPVTMVATSQTVADCVPPTISGTQILPGVTQGVAHWMTNEAADSRAAWGTSYPPTTSASDAAMVQEHTLVLGGLSSCQNYRFEVASADALGNLAVDNAGGVGYPFATGRAIVPVDLTFEGSDGGLVHGGPQDQWAWGAPSSGPGAAHSGSRLWATRLDGPIASPTAGDTDTWLRTGDIDLTRSGQATLEFWHWLNISDWNAGAWLEISSDRGRTWNWLNTELGIYDQTLDYGSPFPGSPCWSSTSSSWVRVRSDLSPWGGETVRIRFRLWWDSSSAWGTWNGWYIDDLRIDSSASCASEVVFDSLVVDDSVLGDGDGRLNPAERAELVVTLRNRGSEAAQVVSGTLSPANSIVAVESGVASFPNLSPGASAASRFRVAMAAGAECGQEAYLDLATTSTDGGGVDLGGARLVVPVGPSRSAIPTAIYGPAATFTPSYLAGSWISGQEWYRLMLAGDEEHRFAPTIVTDVSGLAGYDILVLPGNGVPDEDVEKVLTWLGPGKTLVTAQASIGLAAWSGLLWPDRVGTNGYGSHWTMATIPTAVVLADHPATRYFPAGTSLSLSSYTSTIVDPVRLPPDAVALLRNPSNGWVGLVIRDLPSGGRLVALPWFDVSWTYRPMILDAIAASPRSSCSSRAAISLDRDLYGCEDVIDIEVADAERNLNAGAAETIWSFVASDSEPYPESVALVETTVDSGTFRGSVSVSTTAGAGLVRVAASDEIVATYTDPDFGGVATALTAEADIRGSCSPPVLTGVAAGPVEPFWARVTWNSDVFSDSRVDFGSSAALGRAASVAFPTRTHAVALEPLTECTEQYFTVTSREAFGNSATATDGGVPFRFATPGAEVLLDDDLESGASGWSHSGSGDAWALGTPTVGPAAAHSGTNVFGTRLTGSLALPTDSRLEIPPLRWMASAGATLTFWHWYSTIAYSSQDLLWVEASTDGGLHWKVVDPIGGYPSAQNSYGAPHPQKGAFAGVSQGWRQVRMPLDSYLGAERLQLRFRHWATNYGGSSTSGWYIDDIQIVGRVACGPDVAVAAFEFDDSIRGNSDGVADPGEIVDLPIRVANFGNATAEQTTTLLTTQTPAVTVESSAAAYPDLPPGVEADSIGSPQQITVAADTECGSWLPLQIDSSFRSTGGSATTRTSEFGLLVGVRPLPIRVGFFSNSGGQSASYCGYYSLFPTFDTNWLTSDPGGRFQLVTLADLTSTTLANIDVLVLSRPVPDIWLGSVDNWFRPGRGIVVLAAAACYGSYSGLLWPAGEGQSGAGSLWSSEYGRAQVVQSTGHPVTRQYAVGTVLPSSGSTTAYAFASQLPLDAEALVVGQLDPNRVSIFGRQVPGRGPVVFYALAASNSAAVEAARDAAWWAGWSCRRWSPVSFVGNNFLCQASVGLQVEDAAANVDSGQVEQVWVRVTSPSEPAGELVAMTENAPASGVFAGSIPLSRSPGAGALQVSPGDVLVAEYVGGSDTYSTTAFVSNDCDPPILSGIQATDVAFGRATVSWTTNESSDTRLEWGPTPALGFVTTAPATVLAHTVSLTGLGDCSTLWYRASSTDAAGNTGIGDAGGSPLSLPMPDRAFALAEAFESGSSSFAHDGSSDSWQIGIPTSGPGAAHGGSGAWATNLAGPYPRPAVGGESRLSTPDVVLSIDDRIEVSFWHWYQLYYSTYYGRDAAWVEISTDGGVAWSPVEPVGGYPSAAPSDSPLGYAGRCWSGTSNGWIQSRFDLSAYDGSRVRLRFRLWIDNEIGSAAGWYIDDFEWATRIACGTRPTWNGYSIDDDPVGNSDGILDPGERVELAVRVQELGGQPATGLTATLSTSTPGITIEDSSAIVPNLAAGQTAWTSAPHFRFSLAEDLACGLPIDFHVTIQHATGSSESHLRMRIGEPTTETIRVLVYRSPGVVSYCGQYGYGYSQVVSWLQSDPAMRFDVAAVTSLDAITLGDADVVVLDDAPVREQDLLSIADWFRPGRTIVARGLAACWEAYWGALWPNARWTNGLSNGYWVYSYPTAVRVIGSDPATATLELGASYAVSGSQAAAIQAKLPSDSRSLIENAAIASQDLVIRRNVPGAGTLFHWAPTDSASTVPNRELIRDASAAVAGWACTPLRPLSLDREHYQCADQAVVRLVDAGENRNAAVAESVVVTTWSPTNGTASLTLTETAPNSGEFVANLLISRTTPGTLRVAPDDPIEVTWSDPDAAGTGAILRHASARIDAICDPPVITGVTAITSSRSATVTWSVNQASLIHRVRYGTSCSMRPLVAEANLTPTFAPSVRLPSLVPGRTYYFTVESTNVEGLMATADNGGLCFSFVADDAEGEVYIADLSSRRISRFEPDGTPRGVALDAADGLVGPRCLAFTPDDRMVFTDGYALKVWDPSDDSVRTVTSGFNAPWGLDVNPVTGRVYVADTDFSNYEWDAVYVIDIETGTVVDTLSSSEGDPIYNPLDVLCLSDGSCVVSNAEGTVDRYDSNGEYVEMVSDYSRSPWVPFGVEWHGPSAAYLVAEYYRDEISKHMAGSYRGTFADTADDIVWPTTMAVLPNGDVLVGNEYSGEVLRFAQNGTSMGVFFSTDLPMGVAISPSIEVRLETGSELEPFVDSCLGGGSGHHDGIWDPGETISLPVRVTNSGTLRLNGVGVELRSTTPGVSILDGLVDLPALDPGESLISAPIRIALSPSLACGTSVAIERVITSVEAGPWSTFSTHTVGVLTGSPVTVLNESFGSGIPATWSISDGGSVGTTWSTSNLCSRQLLSPIVAPAAIVDSNCSGFQTFDDALTSPSFNLSTASTVTLELDQWFSWAAGGNPEVASIDVRSSLTGTWFAVLMQNTASSPNPQHITLNLSTWAAGATNVQVRFRYYSARHDGWWIVDNVRLIAGNTTCAQRSCDPLISPPRAIPDGVGGNPMTSQRIGASIVTWWDATTCANADHHILWGALGNPAPQGAICSLGATSSASWTPPTADCWFVVVGSNAIGTEGSWGHASDGAERGGENASGFCATAVRINLPCP